MIIENGIYEIDGEVVMVLRYDRASNKIEVCKLTKFDPNFYGEGIQKWRSITTVAN